MKIIASSDFHGMLPNVNDSFDLFLIAGDICPVECHELSFQDEWLHNEFIEWVNKLPFKNEFSKVVMTWGNHDFYGDNCTKQDIEGIERMCNYRLKILSNESYDFEFPVSDGVDSLKIFGSPYCSRFYNWAFMEKYDILEKLYSEAKEGTDIMLFHDSPNRYGLGDITQGIWKKSGTGNEILFDHIERVKPKLFVSGHFHSGNHSIQDINGTKMANVSYVNEDYQPYWGILQIEYDEENRKFE